MAGENQTRPRVLLVDDEAHVVEVYARLLEDDYRVETASRVEEALERMNRSHFDVVVTDVCMPGPSGVDLSRIVLERFPETEVIVITGNPEIETAMELIQLGIVAYLRKPFACEALTSGIEKCLVKQRQRRSLVEMQRGARSPETAEPIGLGRLVGESPAMQRLHATITRIQHVDTTALILGETGTGKELVARSIHEGGHRRGGPFLAINCAALSSDLLEAELFGHRKGAFTGADRDRVGLIEQAHRGTLFLDEVGEMSLGLQAKLLRVIQERTLRPVGGGELRSVDVRFLAATHQDLQARVDEGSFRQDLFFRLNVYPIRVPPLQERSGDVSLLARHFACELREFHGLPERRLGSEVLEQLEAQDWPGNVRQLRNLVERLLLIATGAEVGVPDLRVAESMDGEKSRVPDPEGCEAPIPLFRNASGSLLSLDQVEVAYIRHVLSECRGNKTKAARILGIHPSTIYRKLAA